MTRMQSWKSKKPCKKKWRSSAKHRTIPTTMISINTVRSADESSGGETHTCLSKDILIRQISLHLFLFYCLVQYSTCVCGNSDNTGRWLLSYSLSLSLYSRWVFQRNQPIHSLSRFQCLLGVHLCVSTSDVHFSFYFSMCLRVCFFKPFALLFILKYTYDNQRINQPCWRQSTGVRGAYHEGQERMGMNQSRHEWSVLF